MDRPGSDMPPGKVHGLTYLLQGAKVQLDNGTLDPESFCASLTNVSPADEVVERLLKEDALFCTAAYLECFHLYLQTPDFQKEEEVTTVTRMGDGLGVQAETETKPVKISVKDAVRMFESHSSLGDRFISEAASWVHANTGDGKQETAARAWVADVSVFPEYVVKAPLAAASPSNAAAEKRAAVITEPRPERKGLATWSGPNEGTALEKLDAYRRLMEREFGHQDAHEYGEITLSDLSSTLRAIEQDMLESNSAASTPRSGFSGISGLSHPLGELEEGGAFPAYMTDPDAFSSVADSEGDVSSLLPSMLVELPQIEEEDDEVGREDQISDGGPCSRKSRQAWGGPCSRKSRQAWHNDEDEELRAALELSRGEHSGRSLTCPDDRDEDSDLLKVLELSRKQENERQQRLQGAASSSSSGSASAFDAAFQGSGVGSEMAAGFNLLDYF